MTPNAHDNKFSNYKITKIINKNLYPRLLLLNYIIFFAILLINCYCLMSITKICPKHIRYNSYNNLAYVNSHLKFNISHQFSQMDKKKRCLINSTIFNDGLSNFHTINHSKRFVVHDISINDIKIQFTDQEKHLINFLKECLAYHKLKTVLRIAGGWVRDKILGLECNDIDIALSDMTGVQFVNLLCEFNLNNSGKSISFGLIEKRPEQSKHLETVVLQIGGLQVDFVNLRHDSYTCDDNRIPDIRIGTEKEDAYRRDFTINSLFYNINTDKVEDLTGMGLDDLKNGIIRTPLDPLDTFLDDPLRVVRAIRFSTRFNFKLIDEIINACVLPEVTNALIKKVTRSRLSNEIYNILISSDQPNAFKLLYQFNLLPWLAEFPKNVMYTSNVNDIINDNNWIDSGIECMFISKHLSEDENYKLPFSTISNEIIDSFYISLFVNSIYDIQYYKLKNKKLDLIEYVIKESLKLHKKHYVQSKELNANSELFNQYLNDIQNIDNADRADLGFTIRSCGRYWKESLFLNFIKYAYNKLSNHEQSIENIHMIADNHIKLYNKIIDLDLEDAYNLQPILNGDQIKKILPKITGGPIFKEIAMDHIKYLLQNRNCTIDEAGDHLKDKYKQFV